MSILHDELLALLRRGRAATQAESLHIDASEQAPSTRLQVSLGTSACLWAQMKGSAPMSESTELQIRQELEKCARALRNCFRAHEAHAWPSLSMPPPASESSPGRMVRARMQQYLEALRASCDAVQVALLHRGRPVAAALALSELQRDRLPLLDRQLQLAAKNSPDSSHGELCQADLFAASFWYDAGVYCFLREPYALDFIRHRVGQVTPELATLLAMLDEDPGGPAKIAPVP